MEENGAITLYLSCVNIEHVSRPGKLPLKVHIFSLPFYSADSLQHSHGRRGLTLEALADVVGVGAGPVLEQNLSGLAGPGHRLEQILYLVSGAKKEKKTNTVLGLLP